MEANFIKASKKAYRYTTVRGMVTTEDLWNMKLEARDSFDLNHVAIALAEAIEATTTKSFVKPTTSKTADEESKLEIVKYIIADKIEKLEKASKAKEKREKRAKLMEIIDAKQDEALQGKSIEELKKELEELED